MRIRNYKIEIRNKFKIQKIKLTNTVLNITILTIRNCFEFRASDLEFIIPEV